MAGKRLKIISWNVNGIRAAIRNGLTDFLNKEQPDILCLQEIKIDDRARAEAQFDFKDYEEFFNPAERKGYSGTAILIKNGLSHGPVNSGIGVKDFDSEGRIQTLEMEKFSLVNAYFPNANHELSRLNYKLEFNKAMLKYLKRLEKRRPVVICGDFNVAHKEIDLKNPKPNIGSAGFTYEEREWIDKLIQNGYIDTFRHSHPDKVQYTWWSYRFNARARNAGWRIDYFFTTKMFIQYIKEAQILDKVRGSDHCPVGIEVFNDSCLRSKI